MFVFIITKQLLLQEKHVSKSVGAGDWKQLDTVLGKVNVKVYRVTQDESYL